MLAPRSATEAVLQNHLGAFLEGKGVDAILADYADHANLFTEQYVFRGKEQIRVFLTDFLAALPPGAITRFSLKSMHIDEQLAYITWSIKDELAGTDTFVVQDGKITSQTVAIVSLAPLDA